MINSILQAFLYTSKFIIGGNGNLDLYYFFSIIIIFTYFIKKPKQLKKVMAFAVAIVVFQLIIGLINGVQQSYQRNLVTISKMILNIILMIYISQKYREWNVKQFINYVTLILLVETIAAFIFQNSVLWRHNDLINVYSKTRLQLLYVEPSELSLHCGFLIILILISIKENGFDKRFILNIAVVGLDILLTAGMSGIACLAIAITIYVIIRIIKRDISKTFIELVVSFMALSLMVLIIKKELLYRIIAIMKGTDGSLYARFLGPSNVLFSVLKSTNYMGLGAGMLNTPQGFSHTGLYYKFPNSIMYFIAEFGAIGIILLIYLNYKIFRIVRKSKKSYLVMPWVYVMVFQIIGGYYTNPFFWLAYGILFSYKYKHDETNVEVQEDMICQKEKDEAVNS